MKGVQYVRGLFKLRHVDHAPFTQDMHSDLIGATSDGKHRLEIQRQSFYIILTTTVTGEQFESRVETQEINCSKICRGDWDSTAMESFSTKQTERIT